MGIGKFELSEATIIANKVMQHCAPAMSRVEIAGSIRREKQVVGDIELVSLVEDQEKLLKLIGDVGQTIKTGVPGVVPWTPKPNAKYIRVRLDEGINLDIFVGRPENWGSLFLMRTGSSSGAGGIAFSGFTPGCFSRWKKLSGGGRMTDVMPTMPDGTQLYVAEEQDFFDLLGMNFVPPVERTCRSVIKKYVIT